MLEAPHLKAVAAVMRVAGIDVSCIELQEERAGTADRGRPTVTVLADEPDLALNTRATEVAVARGGPRTAESSISSRWIEAARSLARGASIE